MVRTTRRGFIAAMGTTALAGCLNSISDTGVVPGANDESSTGPPTSDTTLVLPDTTDAIANSRISGGVPKDGIPSIDDPEFITATEAEEWLGPQEPVFGVSLNNEIKAYPQRVVVWHEVVNDQIGDENVSVTYCPLTGTVQGFKRGETQFGVSGQLINSNLVMYDRGTDSLWPQMLATAVEGDLEGSVLQEFQVTWTTWDRWHDAHPDTQVLSDKTGFARDYNSDPYGSYAPRSGFYADDSLLFEPYSDIESSELDLKDIVLGARWTDGSIAIDKDALATEGILTATIDDAPYVAIYDSTLDTGYIYRNPDDHDISLDNGIAVLNGEEHPPANLPLDQIIRYDAFWFAWAGYYPDSLVVR